MMPVGGMFEAASLVEDQGEYSSQCGYCKGERRSSVSHGMWAHVLTVHDYQGLLDRGWRRSGKFIYKPSLDKTCCPPYTIRLPTREFMPSKEQRRVLRRMERYLHGALDAPGKEAEPDSTRAAEEHERTAEQRGDMDEPSSSSSAVEALQSQSRVSQSERQGKAAAGQAHDREGEEDASGLHRRLVEGIESCLRKCMETGQIPGIPSLPAVAVRPVPPKVKLQVRRDTGDLLYTSNVAFVVAAALRRQKEQATGSGTSKTSNFSGPGTGINWTRNMTGGQQGLAGVEPEGSRDLGMVVFDRVAALLAAQLAQGLPDGITVQPSRGHLNFFGERGFASRSMKHASKVGHARHVSHGQGKARAEGGGSFHPDSQKRARIAPEAMQGLEESVSLNSEAKLRPGQSRHRKLEITIAPTRFIQEEYELYKKYQINVHGDAEGSVSRASYQRFLVDSPLVPVAPSKDGSTPTCGFGSFHQQYRIDGKLVAVGVVDILPKCLSSKYLFWDPDYAFLSLGKYTALQEIEWVRRAELQCKSLTFYYLGYYIHTCPKMKYKAAYAPSELLCPLRFQWIPYSQALPLLEQPSVVAILSPPKGAHQPGDRKRVEALSSPPGTACHESGNGGAHGEEAPGGAPVAEEMALLELKVGSKEEASLEERRRLQAMSEQSDTSMLEAHTKGEGKGVPVGEPSGAHVREVDVKEEEDSPSDSGSMMQLNGGSLKEEAGVGSTHSGESMREDSLDSHEGSKESEPRDARQLSLTPQEEEQLAEEIRAGIGSIPVVISGNSIPFQHLVGLGLLTRQGIAILTRQLSTYHRLVGSQLAGRIGYALS